MKNSKLNSEPYNISLQPSFQVFEESINLISQGKVTISRIIFNIMFCRKQNIFTI
jgi:hypothetical protein